MNKDINSLELKKANTRRFVIASILTFVGICGMVYFVQKMPSDFSFVFETANWAFGMTASTIIALSGLPGISYGRLTSRHLKIIDLVWVLASAVAVIFSVVQVTQLYADAHRATIARNVENARAKAKDYTHRAFQEQCVQPSALSEHQCEILRSIGISIDVGGYLSPALVESLCPRPIDLNNPPPAFSRNLIEACIQSGYAAHSEDDPLLKDKANVDKWRQTTGLWPLWMIFLVALRVMKSVAEVFWGVK